MARGAALGIESQLEEISPEILIVRGELPNWLSGSLVRSVPARYEVGGRRIEHWFDGLAFLNAFAFEGGSVSYTSRYLNSDTLNEAEKSGKRLRRGFANDPCLSIFGRFESIFDPDITTLTDNANVNIGRLGQQWVALTEAPMPIAFDPDSLETLGLVKHRDQLGMGHATPHPHYDEHGAMINCFLKFGLNPTYHIYETGSPDSSRRELATHSVRKPAYMHAFSMTRQWFILIEQPWVIDPAKIARSTKPLRALVDYFSWQPQLGTKLRVFSRSTGHLVATATAPPMFLFHTINAYEIGDEVIVDVAAYDDASVVDAFFLDEMAREDRGFPIATPRRLTIDLRRNSVHVRTLAHVDFELPVIDYAGFNTKPYQFTYGVSRHDQDQRSFWDSLTKVDVNSGHTVHWHESGTYPSEPIFVPRPDRQAEDDGILLSVVLDSLTRRSFLLVLDASDLTEVARAYAPQRIPLGFHGQHIPATGVAHA